MPTFDIIESIFRFNKEIVGINDRDLPRPLAMGEAEWLSKAIREEGFELLDITREAAQRKRQAQVLNLPEIPPIDTLAGQVDACVDAAIFAVGGLARLGLTEEQAFKCFEAVMGCNFAKKAGTKAERKTVNEDGRDVPDAVKPEEWVGPEEKIKEIIKYG